MARVAFSVDMDLQRSFSGFIAFIDRYGFGGLAQIRVLGTSVGDLAFAFLLLVLSAVAVFAARALVVRRLHRRYASTGKAGFWSVIVNFFNAMPWYFTTALCCYLPARFLSGDIVIGRALDTLIVCVLMLEGLRLLGRILDWWTRRHFVEREEADRTTYHFIRIATQIVLVGLGILLLLANLGVQIGPLLASLGIGGIAVAFALQNILRDIFSSFCIFLDKPFVVGDSVTIGPETGTVERIGLRTTRLRTTTGAELSIPNAEVASARVTNTTRMAKRRVTSVVSVAKTTGTEKAALVPKIIADIVEPLDGVTFDRAHLSALTSGGLEYEYVYSVHSGSMRVALDAKQTIHLALLEAFAREGIEMA